ncbi:hypothetical protein [Halomonas marinisediminis]|uniref:Uncharacterized protein n=1 Tax=Halomonas marinisediminis TaxID=2546095 RepID=A0ABY2D7H7_9GAMM|nr:hypothetical protein [Halomonas marinisediminis]TDB02999.1 hypothetical protein E0702_08120 [Halomonas marinisediminis]
MVARMIVVRSLIIWFVILMLAIANGVLRESLLVPLLGVPASLVLSGILLSLLILCVAYLSLPWLKLHRPLPLWLIGVGWLALTLAFEFAFGFWQGKSWPELLEAYTFKGGNIWVVVIAVTVLAPRLAARLRGWV